jgi:membrane-bound metal-dependent hydrolase YbcI (DUF457 family)
VNPIVHGEIAWLCGQGLANRRDRLLVTLAGLAPDLDGISLVGGHDSFGYYHHRLGHGILAAVVVGRILWRQGTDRKGTLLAGLLAFHLHVLCDLAGDGAHWGIVYWWPLSQREWFWEGAWGFVSWQNSLIGLTATLGCLGTAFIWKRTIVETISRRWDAEIVRTLRGRFGRS